MPRRHSRKLPNLVHPGVNFVLRYSRVHVLQSALKHGATRSDISHAVQYFVSQYEIGQSDAADRILIIGPKPTGMLVEILAVLGSDEILTIFHCMPLRQQWINVIKGEPMKVKTISGKNGKVVLPDGSTISHAELEKEADQWASGEFQAKTIRQLVGRPRLGEDIGKVMPIRLEPNLIGEIDRRAKREGITRSALVRIAIARYLAS